MKRLFILLILLYMSTCGLYAYKYLFNNYRSDYSIVIAASASESEKTAAKELQYYLFRIGGATLPITNNIDAAGNCIYVGYNTRVALLTGAVKPVDDDESFTYLVKDDNLFIYGGRDRGSMYGVYSFLEEQFGVRWYTYDCTKIPKKKSWVMVDMYHSESPAFKFRHVFYYTSRANHDWDAHNKVNMTFGLLIKNRWGGLMSEWGGHSMGVMVSPEQYYDSHPEYFSVHNGKRIRNGQLCLSNKDVIKILTQKTLMYIKENPGYTCYNVSQNDNSFPCECEACRNIEKKYGGHSGLIVWAVNQIAKAVENKYPGVFVGTLAYHYSQHAPRNIKPFKNVQIRLCDIECCFAHGIEEELGRNETFLADLKAWSKLTDNLTVWDYMTGFYQYLAPFPNFQSMGQNVKTFRKYRVLGVKSQGQYQSYGGEFYELKQWLLSKLLWNPDEDVQQLATEFISYYYGDASEYVQQYFDLCNSLVTKDTHFSFDMVHTNALFSDYFINESEKILNKAVGKVSGDDMVRRIDRLKLQILYLKYKRSKGRKSAITKKEIKRILKEQEMHVNENQTAEQFMSEE